MNTFETSLRTNFPGQSNIGLRKKIRYLAQAVRDDKAPSILGIKNVVALTLWGQKGLEDVNKALLSEIKIHEKETQ